MRVLLVEDDHELASIIESGLRDHHIDVAIATAFQEASRKASLSQYTVIIIDVMIPGGSGFELCRKLRARGDRSPILMLTARATLEDRVTGLEAGADDYLTKPFAFQELVARVRALARRQPGLVDSKCTIADLTVDLGRRRVERSGHPINLTAKEWDLLEVLARNQDIVLSRSAISERVWDENHDPFTNVLEVLVRRLRRKIDDGFEPKLIHTVRGAGYRLGV
ncbi:MAG TPA: response regulator transcription factor [Longimicrobiales bacterium]|nr:response regulator transcription factor [Longimicrobiales bacterium]